VGGIVAENIGTNSKVDYCWVAGQLRGVNAGGIVKSLAAGKVINCFNSPSAIITMSGTTGYGGGLVGQMSGGSIQNSYTADVVVTRLSESVTIGGIVGDAVAGTVDNCYNYESNRLFYGNKTAAVTSSNSHMVDGTQEDVAAVQTTALEAMEAALNAHVPEGGKQWEGAVNATTTPTVTSGTPPVLVQYAVTP
jgi:hypothetical protein